MKDKQGEPEFKVINEKAVVVTDETLSKTFRLAGPEWEANPPVQPIPKEGRFSMDITNQMVKGAKVKVVNRGKESVDRGQLEEPPSESWTNRMARSFASTCFARGRDSRSWRVLPT